MSVAPIVADRRTVDIGYSRSLMFSPDRAHKHAVVRKEGAWVLVCSDHPATREYKGWATTVTCPACTKKINGEGTIGDE